jgi:RecQ family ATP-dependent DNA helicase
MRKNIVVTRDHQAVPVKEHPQREIKKIKGNKGQPWTPNDPVRTVGIEEWSMMDGEVLRTIFIALDFLDVWHNTILETKGYEYPITAVLEYLVSLRDNDGNLIYAERHKPGNTRLRTKEYDRENPDVGGRHAGFRHLPKMITLPAHAWELLIGRSFRNNQQMRKSVKAAVDGGTIHVDGWELVLIKNLPGGAGANFTMLAIKDGLVMRLRGQSIKGQSATTTPVQNAEAYLGRHDLVPPPDNWRKRQFSSLSEDEIKCLKSYVATSANIARELHEKIAEGDRAISPYITRRDGTHPPTVAGAAIRAALSRLEVDSFEKPSWRVQQIGALTAAGGNFRMFRKPGYYEHVYLYDGDLWYGDFIRQPPSPATCTYPDIAPGSFDIERWESGHSHMQISGIVLPTRFHPLRVHDPVLGRLKYLEPGPFIQQWFAGASIVFGVKRGVLKVTHIHDGIELVGTNEGFLKDFAEYMYNLKVQQPEGSPLYKRIKSMVHVIPGKMLQVNTGHPYISELARGIEMPIDTHKFYKRQRDVLKDMFNGYYESIEAMDDVAEGMYQHSKYPTHSIKFGEYLNTHLGPKATTGAFYLPAHGSLILDEAHARITLLAEMIGDNTIATATDSVLVTGEQSEAITRYNAFIRRMGRSAPESGMGSMRAKIKDGWGYIISPAQWVIRYHADDGTVKQKHALHNMGELEDADDDTIWHAMEKMVRKHQYTYHTKPRPATYLEALKLKIEPGTLVSHRQVVTLQREEVMQDATRTQQLLAKTANALTAASEYKPGTTETARGCVKILKSYGLEYTEIAEMTGIALSTLKLIASGKKSGIKSHEKLRQAVHQFEIQQQKEAERQAIHQMVNQHEEQRRVVNASPIVPNRPQLTVVPKTDPIQEEFNKLSDAKFGTPEWKRLKELSDILMEREDTNDLAKKTFGYEQLRDEQTFAIEQITAGKDALVIMPTGGGKSAIFQTAALKLKGITIVISPLIALMNEQVLRLESQDVPATYINSSLGKKERVAREKAILSGTIKLLYVAPESLEKVVPFLQDVSLIAVDEAHLISQWGHEFRPKYRQLAQLLRDQFPNAPAVALTASATPEVQQDIIEQLQMHDPYIHIGSFDRTNLEYTVIHTSSEYEKVDQLTKALKDHTPSIIYVRTQADTEALVITLRRRGIKALAYHAGLKKAERTEAQRKFTDGEINILVATIAFGMGIDKSNIRSVIHYDIPDSMERYHQETGRAGRDGETAQCTLLYHEKDVAGAEYILRQVNANPERQGIALRKLEQMKRYAESGGNYREQILTYFTSSGT